MKSRRINSNLKGKRGEREWANYCKMRELNVSRTAQHCGKHDPNAADCVGLPKIHQEIKREEKLNIYKALCTAKEEAYSHSKKTGKNLIPIIAHRKNNQKWMVTMSADDWINLYKNLNINFINT